MYWFSGCRLLPVYVILFLIAGCGGGGGGGSSNARPIANAGPDQSVDEAVTVSLDGSGSTDAEGSISYAWSQSGGTAVSLSSRTTARPSFESPLLLADETLIFRLTVTDASGASASDTVAISVVHENLLPIAEAGDDQVLLSGNTVSMSGNSSSDPEGPLTFEWQQTQGPNIVLSDATAAAPTFFALIDIVDYSLAFELTVTDADGATALDSVTIDVGGVTSGVVRIGTIAGGTVEFFDAMALNDDPVYSTTSGDGSITERGMVLVPATDLSQANPFQRGQYYVAKVSGGLVSDIDNDGLVDADQFDFDGSGHALLTGDQILDESFSITSISELVFQRVANRLMAKTESERLLESLDQTAAMQLNEDINADGFINADDLAVWDPIVRLDALRRPNDFQDLSEAIREAQPPTRVSDFGNASLFTYTSMDYTGAIGVVERVGSSAIYLMGINSVGAIDITDPDNPQELGRVNLADALSSPTLWIVDYVIQDDTIYITTFDELIAVDFSNINAPVVLGSVDIGLPGALVLAVQNDVAYVATSTELEVYDISNPASMQLANSVLAAGSQSIALSGVTLLLTGGTSVRSFDVSDPLNPIEQDFLSIGDAVGAISIFENIAYAFADYATIVSLDIQDPDAIAEIGRVEVLDAPGNISAPPNKATFQLIGTELYVTATDDREVVLDISDPAAMFVTGFVPLPPSDQFLVAKRGQVVGDRWYRGTGIGYVALDLAFKKPILHDQIVDLGFSALAVDANNRVYATSTNDQVQIFQSNADGTLTPLGTAPGFFNIDSMEVDLPYLYLSSHDKTVIVDVSDPAAAAITGELTLPKFAGSSPSSICVNAGYIYKAVLTEPELEVIDARDPANPFLAGTLSVDQNSSSVADECDTTLFVNSANGFLSFDLSVNPVTPPRLPNGNLNDGLPRALDVEGDLMVTAGNSVIFSNISTPGAPVVLQRLPLLYVQDVEIEGDFVYLVTTNKGLITISLDDADTPVVDSVLPDIRAWTSVAIAEESVIYSGFSRLTSTRKAQQPLP